MPKILSILLDYAQLFEYNVRILHQEKHMTGEKKKLKKSPALYIVMMITWVLLSAWLWYTLVSGFISPPIISDGVPSRGMSIAASILLVLNGVFITYFWLNGVKDFIYVIWYHISKRLLMRRYAEVMNADVSGVRDKVLMLYCTCNDFDGNSLRRCMEQDYGYTETVILDDSSDVEYKKSVDEFAEKYGVRVVRRADRKGFKAGNINHFLLSEEARASDYRYAVILDSDEIIPRDFITECLKYFAVYDNIGMVQANHVATRNRNLFMKLFHIGVDSHWPTYQSMKHRYGFSSMLGHGAMIKRECYEEAGGFPDLVAEDLCLSIEMRNKGYYIAFAPNIICEEEYPIDYLAFKKRHSKWTQGNLEFIKKYTGKIIRSKMAWHEKLDIVLFTYNLPLTAIFAFYIFINISVMPVLGIDIGSLYPIWMLIPTIVFFLSPMLNDVFVWLFRINIFRFAAYMLCVIVLYGSMLFTSLTSALLGMFGRKAKFIVTPKDSHKILFITALKAQYKELLFSAALIALSVFFCRSIWPVSLIAATGILSFFLLFLSNKKYDERTTCAVDAKTVSIALRQNKALVVFPEKVRVKKGRAVSHRM